MVQKVAAPKTYKPSGGRPVERLAYLNESEMEFLRQFNGDNVERGPKGIPSFADDSASSNGVSRGDSSGTRGSSSTMSNSPQSGGRGAGSNYGGGSGRPGTTSGGGGLGQGGQGGSSSASRGAGNSSPSGSRTSGPSSSTASQSKGPSGPTSPMGGQGASFSTPKAASSYNKDESIKNSLQKRDTINSIKNTPAIRNDGVTGFKAQALGVRPTGAIREAAPVTITPPPKLAGHPVKNEMEVNRNLAKITDSFYASDFDTGMAVSRLQNAEKAARESLGMYGKSQTAQPRDKLSAPARTATSTGITPMEREGIMSLRPDNLIKSGYGMVSNAAKSLYNDPAGSLSSAASYGVGALANGVNAIGDYAKDAYQTIAMASDPRYSSYPEVQTAAAEKAAEIALNYGIGGVGTSFATKSVPKGAITAFGSPAISPLPDMKKAYAMAKGMWNTYGPKVKTAEQFSDLNRYVAGVTRKITPGPVSGIQRVGNRLGVEVEAQWDPKTTAITPGMKISDVFRKEPLRDVFPSLNDINVVKRPEDLKDVWGFYQKEGTVPMRDPKYTGVFGTPREYIDMGIASLRGEQFDPNKWVNSPVVSLSTMSEPVLAKEPGQTLRSLMGHEAGTHALADFSAKIQQEFNNPNFGRSNFYGAAEGPAIVTPSGTYRRSGSPVGPEAYARSIMKSNPGMPYSLALAIGRDIYNKHIEEIAANLVGARSGLPQDALSDNLISEILRDEWEKNGLWSDQLRQMYGSEY